jgi:phosphoribosylaminoimidazolecarboxamide formyltransferase/IMP cyclohydrolase
VLALLSVSDKSGLITFATALVERGYGLVASGGTARALLDAGLAVVAVEDLTGFPELLGGRVKTLHPAVHAGILSRRSAADVAELAARGIAAIDLVAVDLYPFEAALKRGDGPTALVEEIDIGGVTLLRAAAKNFEHVTVVPGPAYYDEVIAGLASDVTALRRRMAGAAFALTASYDRAIAGWLGESLRYGENPHQAATFIPGATRFEQHAGKELSYNNLLDLDAAWSCVVEQRTGHNAVVVKHGSPCGIARAPTQAEAIARAIAADQISAFGGIVAIDHTLDLAAAEALGDLFLEVVAAPAVTPEAVAHLRKTKKNCRLVTLPLATAITTARSVLGGTLVQAADMALPEPTTWTTPTTMLVSDLELCSFAWLAVKHVKSNAIVLAAREGDVVVTVGIGGGQTNRIDAVRQACERAGERARGAVLASDAFFPFADGVEAAAAAGVTVVMQPGGALRDAEVIAAADRLGVAMVLTHRRHFRH